MELGAGKGGPGGLWNLSAGKGVRGALWEVAADSDYLLGEGSVRSLLPATLDLTGTYALDMVQVLDWTQAEYQVPTDL